MSETKQIADDVSGKSTDSGEDFAKVEDKLAYQVLGEEWDGGEVPKSVDSDHFTQFRDRYGRAFDAEIHRTGDNRRPKVTKKRYNLMTLPGKTPDQESKSDDQETKLQDTDDDKTDETEESPFSDLRISSELLTDGFVMLHKLFMGGEKWEMSENEREDFVDNIVRYQRARFGINLPPEAYLLYSIIQYYQPRMNQEELILLRDAIMGQPEQEQQERQGQKRKEKKNQSSDAKSELNSLQEKM